MPQEEQNQEENVEIKEDSVVNPNITSVLEAINGLPGSDESIKNIQSLNSEEEKPEEAIVETKEVDPNNTEEVVADLLVGTIKAEEKQKLETEVEIKAEAETQEEIEVKKVEEERLAKEESEAKENIEEEKPVIIKSPIFKGGESLGKKTEEIKPVEYEGSSVANEYIKEQTGYENLESLVASSLEFKEKLSSVDKLEATIAKYDGIFSKMPVELYQGVLAFSKGEDWKTPIFSKPNLDFTKNLEGQETKNLVENYFPGEVTKAEWEDYNSEDPDLGMKKAIDMAISQSKLKFETDKIDLQNYSQNQIENAEKQNKIILDSINKSIEHLKSNIDGLDDGYINQTRNNLSIQKLNELFFTKDGSFKEDAALKITMAEHGHDMLAQYKTVAKHQAETKERQEVLGRTPDKPKAKKKAEIKTDEIRPEVKEHIDSLLSGMGSNSFY